MNILKTTELYAKWLNHMVSKLHLNKAVIPRKKKQALISLLLLC